MTEGLSSWRDGPAKQAVTMGIYANASSAATREALRRLGDIRH
jgi:hypothetical protein